MKSTYLKLQAYHAFEVQRVELEDRSLTEWDSLITMVIAVKVEAFDFSLNLRNFTFAFLSTMPNHQSTEL